MYQISIKGEAKAFLNHKPFPQHLIQELNGIDIQDDFVDYIDEPYQDKLEKGYTRFVVENNKLYAVCEYTAKQELTKEELESLVDYTRGQWSDGIGEGFEQEPCMYIDDAEVYVSPWIPGQKCTVEQIELC